MTLSVVLLLILNLWTISRLNHLRMVVREFIQVVAGVLENMKRDHKFGRDSEEFALEGIYRVVRLFDGTKDTRL